MIERLLVANRAEIASRVFRTCRRLGIQTVAVHSDADAGLAYVAEADLSVRLPGTSPAATYLRGDLLLDAAERAGADAVHPGYGFLSENAAFARDVEAAGLTWVGPTPESIEAMGSKVRAKELVREAGVPVLAAPAPPGAGDLPLIVKASAGGGGRGMRIVRDLEQLEAAVAAAGAEAASAFGDGTVFVEPYVGRGRHVEVQVLGDGRGAVLALGTRDCSLQRRHQKVIEEAPAPGLAPEVEDAMLAAARAAAEAIGYRGAGTVEFLYDPATQRFFFLEMNTRLQVEHPVTEAVLGVDLVERQLAIAEGTGLGTGASRPARPGSGAGHAIEARLYAEDPAADHQPQSGVLTAFDISDALPGAAGGVRVDTGFRAGDEVTTHYDAMLAKVVVHAPTRAEAARRLADVLRRSRVHGVTTNRDQLVALLHDDDFRAATHSTSTMAERPFGAAPTDTGALAAAALALAAAAGARRTVQGGLPVAWRNVVSAPQTTTFCVGGPETGGEVEVAWLGTRDGLVVDGATVVVATPDRVVLEVDGLRTAYAVAVGGGSTREVVDVDWSGGHLRARRVPRFVDPAQAASPGSLLAPMPGTVAKVVVERGARVEAGAAVLVLEAMKMQHTVAAPAAGTVTSLPVVVGEQVAAGEVLAVVESEEDA